MQMGDGGTSNSNSIMIKEISGLLESPTTVCSLAEVILPKDQVRIQSLPAVHDPLDGRNERVLGPIVPPEVISLNTPDLPVGREDIKD